MILDQDDAPSRPDVVLLDMGSPNALDSAQELADRLPEFKAIALGVVEERDEVVACAEARVASYVSRDASLDDLVEAVVGAIRGGGIVGGGGWSWPHPDPSFRQHMSGLTGAASRRNRIVLAFGRSHEQAGLIPRDHESESDCRCLRPRAAFGGVLAPIASVPERVVRDVPEG